MSLPPLLLLVLSQVGMNCWSRVSRFPRPGNTGSIANMLSSIAYSEVAAVIPLLLKPGINSVLAFWMG